MPSITFRDCPNVCVRNARPVPAVHHGTVTAVQEGKLISNTSVEAKKSSIPISDAGELTGLTVSGSISRALLANSSNSEADDDNINDVCSPLLKGVNMDETDSSTDNLLEGPSIIV